MERPTYLVHDRFGVRDREREITVEYATEAELLDFANRVREAGGANALDALLPSKPGDAHDCLIATALNFGCRVLPDERIYERNLKNIGVLWTGEYNWFLVLPGSLDADRLEKMAEAVGSTPEFDEVNEEWFVRLPQHIGNAADAFDEHAGWTTKYAPEDY